MDTVRGRDATVDHGMPKRLRVLLGGLRVCGSSVRCAAAPAALSAPLLPSELVASELDVVLTPLPRALRQQQQAAQMPARLSQPAQGPRLLAVA